MKVTINAQSINQLVNADTANVSQQVGQGGVENLPVTASSETPVSAGTLKANARKIFISYRRKDGADVVGRIYEYLTRQFGTDMVFEDVYAIPLGVNFKEYLMTATQNCSVLLAVMGDGWLAIDSATGKSRLQDEEDWVRAEIEAALSREIPVIPLLIRDAFIPSKEQLPASLEKLTAMNGLRLRPDPDFQHDMNRLIQAIEIHVK
jgi:hypothetical protein